MTTLCTATQRQISSSLTALASLQQFIQSAGKLPRETWGNRTTRWVIFTQHRSWFHFPVFFRLQIQKLLRALCDYQWEYLVVYKIIISYLIFYLYVLFGIASNAGPHPVVALVYNIINVECNVTISLICLCLFFQLGIQLWSNRIWISRIKF